MSAHIKNLKGKTIKAAHVQRIETLYGCAYASVELEFTDGTMFSFQLRAMPQVDAMFFKSAEDGAKIPMRLVKP
jgi:hypothetical protein